MAIDGFVPALQAEENFVALAVITETRGIVRLDEVDVEVALGLRRRAVVRCPEEEVTVALDAPILPFDLILPDLVTSNVARFVGSFHQLADGAIVGAIERVVR